MVKFRSNWPIGKKASVSSFNKCHGLRNFWSCRVRLTLRLRRRIRYKFLAIGNFFQFFGTGWRKNRPESRQSIFWDGENLGGKSLMMIRHELKKKHAWSGPGEEEVTFFTEREYCNLISILNRAMLIYHSTLNACPLIALTKFTRV